MKGGGLFSLVRGQRAFFQRYRRGHILLKPLAFECCVMARGPGFNHQQTLSPDIITKANIAHLKYVCMVHVPLLLVFAKNNFKSKMLHDVMNTFHLRILLFLIYVHLKIFRGLATFGFISWLTFSPWTYKRLCIGLIRYRFFINIKIVDASFTDLFL